ncbi:hypothetical protein P7K49_034647 [Saguinus oedipus]|uniref:Uncharacterized protein n=1 Tax=Saguinus oedipus TaxID=9490 RepID=A0ABQ9TW69_SAGOE|nr:hypothetical protein P7K49_034647 [Saguinus oedipus]
MAEGERTECAEPPRDEPPTDGALKRAEELKTQANDYFKGWTAAQAEGCRARAEPWQRGAAAWARGRHYQVTGRREARDGVTKERHRGLRRRALLSGETEEGATKCGARGGPE